MEIHFVKARVFLGPDPGDLFYASDTRYRVPCTINYRDKQTPANYTRPLHETLTRHLTVNAGF